MTTEVKKELINKEIKKIEGNFFLRLFNSTPKYFQVLMGFGLGLVGLALAIADMPTDLKSHIPIVIVQYAETIAWVGGAIVFISAQTHNRDKTLAKLKAKYELNEEDED